MLLALIIQNALHPKNSNRREAIEKNEYRQITNKKEATAFIGNLLSVNMNIELKAKQSELLTSVDTIKAKHSADLFVQASDIYLAAAVMVKSNLFQGKGDLQRIFEAISAKPTESPVLL